MTEVQEGTLDDYRNRLQAALVPTVLRVTDGSAAHAGHAGAASAGPVSHLGIEVQAACLEGLSVVQQHQKIYAALQPELSTGELHAVQIKVL
jgi:BolA protein